MLPVRGDDLPDALDNEMALLVERRARPVVFLLDTFQGPGFLVREAGFAPLAAELAPGVEKVLVVRIPGKLQQQRGRPPVGADDEIAIDRAGQQFLPGPGAVDVRRSEVREIVDHLPDGAVEAEQQRRVEDGECGLDPFDPLQLVPEPLQQRQGGVREEVRVRREGHDQQGVARIAFLDLPQQVEIGVVFQQQGVRGCVEPEVLCVIAEENQHGGQQGQDR